MKSNTPCLLECRLCWVPGSFGLVCRWLLSWWSRCSKFIGFSGTSPWCALIGWFLPLSYSRARWPTGKCPFLRSSSGPDARLSCLMKVRGICWLPQANDRTMAGSWEWTSSCLVCLRTFSKARISIPIFRKSRTPALPPLIGWGLVSRTRIGTFRWFFRRTCHRTSGTSEPLARQFACFLSFGRRWWSFPKCQPGSIPTAS